MLGLGEGRYGRSAASSSPAATLYADRDGHFISEGTINGISVRFVVDTGATAVAMNSREAGHLGLNYRTGTRARASTAGISRNRSAASPRSARRTCNEAWG